MVFISWDPLGADYVIVARALDERSLIRRAARDLTTEQDRWTEINGRLDELERMLAKK